MHFRVFVSKHFPSLYLLIHYCRNRLGDLPADCLLAYYESRRRWIYGGVSLTTKGLSIEGVKNEGTNSQKYNAHHTLGDESMLSVAGVGASQLNQTTVCKMGDYRERLLWSRAPIVGYTGGSSSATTAPDGSPTWSADDDALPISFFDPKTGVFADSAHARIRARLAVNFGNPYKDKRGDSLVPEMFRHQRPQLQHKGGLLHDGGGGGGGIGSDDDRVVTGNDSPPHGTYV